MKTALTWLTLAATEILMELTPRLGSIPLPDWDLGAEAGNEKRWHRVKFSLFWPQSQNEKDN